MATLPESGVKLVVELGEYNNSIDMAIKRANEVDSLTPTVKVQASDQELDSTVKKVASLDSESATVKVNTDDAEVKETQSLLDTMKDSKIVVTLGVAGGAVAAVTGILGAVGVGGIIEYDNALAKIQGRTGEMIPIARELIEDLYTSGWGESRDQIADVIIQADNLGIAQDDLAEATRKAFEVAASTGGETNEVLRTMDSLVKTKLATSYTEAADIIVTGFQEGINRGDDFLDTFNEYATKLSEVGLSGKGALALINSGISVGIDNSDRLADAIRETGTRLGEIGTDPNIANAFKQLDSMSSIDLAGNLKLFEAGELSGDDFWEGFFQSLQEAAEKDKGKANTIAATLIGTQAEDFGVTAFAGLTTAWDETLGKMEGRAAESGAAISDTLGSTIQGFVRSAEEAAIDFLSSEQIDLPGKIAALKGGLQDGLAALQEDGDLGNALTVALKPIGFDDEFQGLESMLGNFVIAILQVVSSLQALDPAQWGAKAGTDRLITQLSTDQLAFDLQVGNPDEVAGEIATAVSRGVAPDAIAATIGTAVNELIEAGTPALAASLLAAVQQAQTDANANVQLTGSGSLMNTEPLLNGEDFTALQESINAAQTAASEAVDPVEQAAEQWQTLTGQVNKGQTPTVNLGKAVGVVGSQFVAAVPFIKKVPPAIDAVAVSSDNAITSVGGFGGQVAVTDLYALTATDSLTQMNTALGIIIATAGNVAAAADALANAPRPAAPTGGGNGTRPVIEENAGGGIFSGMSWVGEDGPEIITSDTSLAVLNNTTSIAALMAAMQTYIPGGSYNGGGARTNVINNTNIVPSIAVADRLGYSQAATLRGAN